MEWFRWGAVAVIFSIEGNTHLLDCITTEEVCSIQSFCKPKGMLGEAE
jgi:Rrf2 family nitric oxide-sensitive transcriptional repressor